MRALLLLIALTACAELNNPYYQDPYYNEPSYSNPYYYDDSYYNRKERERLERERRRLEWEREKLEKERERERRNHLRGRPSAPPLAPMNCPSGFSPSNSKCSDKERRSRGGCRDMRLPNGQLCVDR